MSKHQGSFLDNLAVRLPDLRVLCLKDVNYVDDDSLLRILTVRANCFLVYQGTQIADTVAAVATNQHNSVHASVDGMIMRANLDGVSSSGFACDIATTVICPLFRDNAVILQLTVLQKLPSPTRIAP